MPETALHRYHLCPANATIDDPHGWLEDTKAVGKSAAEEWSSLPCFWGRAIIPGKWLDTAPAAEKFDNITLGSFPDALRANGGVLYTDGSGGPRAPPHLTQVASGLCAFTSVLANEGPLPERLANIEVGNLAIGTAAVPGRQTVPR